MGVAVTRKDRDLFIKSLKSDFEVRFKHNKTSLEKKAAYYGISDQTEVKEYAELALVKLARSFAHSSNDYKLNFEKLVKLYNWQANLSHRTSTSISLQQYSTPAPIAYLAGIFVQADRKETTVFEPSAGNGLLTIAAEPKQVIVNEIDELRRSNLSSQGFKKVLNQDGKEPFFSFKKSFDAILTNPPFGHREVNIQYEGYPITSLEHIMAIRALETMKDKGKAAILVGGLHEYDDKDRIRKGKDRFFYNYLYKFYHVADVIQLDGNALYSRMGTAFDIRLILINGRKEIPQGAAPLKTAKDTVINSFGQLYERVMESVEEEYNYKFEVGDQVSFIGSGQRKLYGTIEYLSNVGWYEVRYEKRSLAKVAESDLTLIAKKKGLSRLLLQEMKAFKATHPLYALGGYYYPGADSCTILDTMVPDSMDFETHQAVSEIKQKVGGDLASFVMNRLNYQSFGDLCKSLSAEQIDAVALAIYNIEYRGQGMIIGDQTGIGKGRIAASMIRYAHFQGLKPIVFTEKPNLYSDLYRDLIAIGSGHLNPFIVNTRESKTDIKDEDGNIIYQAANEPEQKKIFADQRLPAKYDLILATYSQINSAESGKAVKPQFLVEMARNNIVIMDESHNASGTSNTGVFLQKLLSVTRGVTFLSATFAKRPDNMPIYAKKTAINEANLSDEELIDAIVNGGVALQEILASQLVSIGQMIRRERSFEGVEVNYVTLEAEAEEHKAIADNITSIIRDIISFQLNHIKPELEEMDDLLAAEGEEITERGGTSMAGIDNEPYFSKVFNVINQMLFSIKAESVADRAIMRLKEGKKPVIAFSSTMGSFLDDMQGDDGLTVKVGDVINADFTEVLKRGLESVLRYTKTNHNGKKEFKEFKLEELPQKAKDFYSKIHQQSKTQSSGITISPIDLIIQKIEKAGYKVAEVTGRKYTVQLNQNSGKGLLLHRNRIPTNDAFRQFNNNEIDVLLINQSGSTGASAHAIVTPTVPLAEVKQRVMIVLQPELNINTEVQKRGRINRTGQVLKPIYDYMSSAIPAEKRLMMMLQQKLKSLDANTSSNQKQSQSILSVEDFLNKYGDEVVVEYLKENESFNISLDDPLKLLGRGSRKINKEDAAKKVTGRVAVLSTKMQQEFYNEIIERYNAFVHYLKQTGEYDLEVETLDLQAETISREVVKVGKGGGTVFGSDSIMEIVEANVLKKPYTKPELESILSETLQGRTNEELTKDLMSDYDAFAQKLLEEDIQESNEYYDRVKARIREEKEIKAIKNKDDREMAIWHRESLISQQKEENEEWLKDQAINKSTTILKILNYFKTGQDIENVQLDYEGTARKTKGVFIGYMIDKKKRNPYSLSAIKLRFALASNDRYIEIPASKDLVIEGIYQRSKRFGTQPTVLRNWELITSESQASRQVRYIISGNLLQGLGTFKGKLVSYTLRDGGESKGILMPGYWTPKEFLKDEIIVPVQKALPLILRLSDGDWIGSKNEVIIKKDYPDYILAVAPSKSRGGDFFLDKELIALSKSGKFSRKSQKMIATYSRYNIEDLVKILEERFNLNVLINKKHFPYLNHTINEYKPPVLQPIPKLLELEISLMQLPLIHHNLNGLESKSLHPNIRYILK